jgi:hypothetical protein
LIIAHEQGTDSWFFWHPLEGVGLASWEVKRAGRSIWFRAAAINAAGLSPWTNAVAVVTQ